ncbi:FAD-binding oxidoreductase [Pararoseomonas indoligenes]|uniref:D-lactate dehydrogenase (cytochrome) n=1 Tax=Roseomonas indoligenes TaxID=2820811 RepID=A0A940N9J7_9PROT|nr:FAD-linked oxidase C-terminal domain-containing protein [Pararoseomonas indoligenes]MBP0496522.1 FAD-binding protein [Pararoseomonas indoligenes]
MIAELGAVPPVAEATPPAAGAIASILPALRTMLGERLSTGNSVREQHGRGEGVPDLFPPDAVTFPESNEEVAAIARLCSAHRVPIVPFGAGTSLEGHVTALRGGLSVDLSRMDRVLDVSPEALDCRVQAGMTRLRLNAELRSHGLFFPIDPGADASIGGMAATRASGTAAVRYGTMRENVLGLTVVTPDGRIVRIGSRARKSSTGLDLTRLYVGSEGTLGLITEVQLRLHGLPEAVSAAVCQFPDVRLALDATISILQAGIPMARIEFVNALQMRMCIRYSKLEGLAEQPTLFLEFQGSPAAVAEQVELVQALCEEAGGNGFLWANRPEERSRLWKARHDTYYANLHYLPGRSQMGTDACVPISALAECILETEADVAATGLLAPLVGHVGDGNFHLGILFDPTSPEERARADGLARRTGERAIRLGGTCSGEHGIGMHKLDLAAEEHGEALSLMWAVKNALDPLGIMNPGKLLKPLN